MNFPINGRIAIIDDQVNQALPLINILSKNRVPFAYYSGDVSFLPEADQVHNDIRILFLDINLIDNTERSDKELKAQLIPVLRRVITPDNYPYVVIYWSRHEDHKNLVEQDIFNAELSDRKPIAFLSAVKSDFINLDGTYTDEFEDRIQKLFSSVDAKIAENPSYSYLMNWENTVHYSSDSTLERIFQPFHKHENWSEHANYLVKKLGEAYSGEEIFDKLELQEKVKSFYSTLNLSFIDTLENIISLRPIPNASKFPTKFISKNVESVYSINSKLLISKDLEALSYPGTVYKITSPISKNDFEKIFGALSNDTGKRNKEVVLKSAIDVWVNVTPLCDAVQKKVVQHRLVKGILIECFKNWEKSFNTNEAIFISAPFSYDGKNYLLFLDFRHFFTLSSFGKSKFREPIFRIRQQLLAEIQSKLSRHINRQGILALHEKI